MKILKQLPAYILGFIFIVIPLDHFLHYFPKPEGLPVDVATYFNLMNGSGYMTVIKVIEIIGAILVIMPKTRKLGYLILAPIALNIMLFELFIWKQPGMGGILTILAAIGLYLNKDSFKSILD